jgi:hypothetical protein
VLNVGPGQSNELTLVLNGNDGYVFVNDAYVTTVVINLPPFSVMATVDGTIDGQGSDDSAATTLTVWT